MLFNQLGDKIERMPHEDVWKIINTRLSKKELIDIFDELDTRFTDSEINTSSWLPGADWTNTVYFPIWDRAAKKNEEMAAKMFGLVVWVYVMQRVDAWMFGKYNDSGDAVRGTTYFRVPKLD